VVGRKRKGKLGKWVGRVLTALLVVPTLYLAAALTGALVPVNAKWREPAEGTTVYLADNGIHADVIMPVRAQGVDWSPLFSKRDFAALPDRPGWIAFGSGERHVYLDTPSWSQIRLRTISAALTGGSRVIHVEYVPSPSYAVRQLRLRPDEYRRLWAAIRSDFDLNLAGKPQRINHPGYGPSDAFYRATGRANAIRTCNAVVANWLRLAGVKTSLWSPFIPGLVWRYRRTGS
jgi:uncharacterized protein (TIGR02117 family)